MTKILYINGDGDYDAMVFERQFPDMNKVVKEFRVEHVTDGVTVSFEDEEDEGMRYLVTLRVLEFGEVDEDFISWVMDTFVDYDMTKGSNFHILSDEPVAHRMMKDIDDDGEVFYRAEDDE